MTNPSSKQASEGRPDRGALSRKDFACEVKAVDDNGGFEIYAAVFNNIDRVGDVIVPGAFANLKDFVAAGWIALNHDNLSLPIGFVDSAVQDSKGLRIKGRFHSTPEAQAVRTVVCERMAAGKDVLCSIGYRTIDEAPGKKGGQIVNLLKTLEIFEASFVNLPANPEAGAVNVKSDNLIALETVESVIERYKAGRTISSANHTKLKEFAKGLDAHGKAACTMARGLKDWLSQHGPVDDDEEQEDEDGNIEDEADEEAEPSSAAKKPKPKKSIDTASAEQGLRARVLRARVTTLRP